jgi:hypothetical protein
MAKEGWALGAGFSGFLGWWCVWPVNLEFGIYLEGARKSEVRDIFDLYIVNDHRDVQQAV